MSDSENGNGSAGVQKTVKMEPELADAIDSLKHGKFSEETRDYWRGRMFGEDAGQRSRIERLLEQERNERRKKERKVRELQAEIENHRDAERDYEEQLSNLTSEEDRYEAKLETIEASLRTGTHITTDFPAVPQAAGIVDRTPEGVIEDLKERNPDVPDYAFTPVPDQAERHPVRNPKWDGLPEDEIDVPVEEREGEYR